MTTPARITTAALALWLGAATAQPLPTPTTDAPHAPDAPLPRFEQLDTDADRVLTLEEVPPDSALYRDFARWDANKDGVLNVPEFQRHERQIAQLD